MSDDKKPIAVGALNLNTFVRFKMTERGVDIAKRYWESARFTFPNVLFQIDKPDIDCEQQFHDMVRIFGGENMHHDMDGSPIYDLFVLPMP